MERRNRFSKNAYIAVIIAIYILILVSPFIVKSINFENNEFSEFIFLFLLLLLGLLANHYYRKQSTSYEDQINLLKSDRTNIQEKLVSAFKHIGILNVQLEELSSIFTKFRKYPETKQELKNILTYYTEKTLLIANTEWVLFRVVDVKKIKSLTEIYLSRKNDNKFSISISNKNLINKLPVDDLSVISSTEDNFRINAYFIFPAAVNHEQKIMIETIANQAEMLYIIYSSAYYNGEKAG
jgi:hypothetical protein